MDRQPVYYHAYAKGLAERSLFPDQAAGKIYEVCLGRSPCTHGYLTHHQYLAYRITTLVPLLMSAVSFAGYLLFVWSKEAWK